MNKKILFFMSHTDAQYGFEEISPPVEPNPELSSSAHFRIQGGGLSVTDEGRTDGNLRV